MIDPNPYKKIIDKYKSKIVNKLSKIHQGTKPDKRRDFAKDLRKGR